MSDICDYLIFDAPFPPSLNALFEPHKIGKRVSVGKSKRYKDFQKNVFFPWWMSIRSKGKINMGTEVMLWMVNCPPRSNCDLDNYNKCFNDSLQAAEGIIDDKYIVSMHNEKGPRVSGGLLRVFLANERHREQLTHDYFDEFNQQWLPRRSGKILNPPQGLRHRRVAMV